MFPATTYEDDEEGDVQPSEETLSWLKEQGMDVPIPYLPQYVCSDEDETVEIEFAPVDHPQDLEYVCNDKTDWQIVKADTPIIKE